MKKIVNILGVLKKTPRNVVNFISFIGTKLNNLNVFFSIIIILII